MAAKKVVKASEETESELQEKVLFINRCSKVVKGGRKFSFSALVIVGDGNGRIGVGFAKANEVADAIKKGGQAARKEMIELSLEDKTIPHETEGVCDGARVLFKPASEGTGVIAGSVVRSVLEIAGIRNITAKSLGSNNPINLVRASVNGLSRLRSRKELLAARGIGV